MGACVSKGPGVTVYKGGYKEHACRLLFAYEDHFGDKEPDLVTILPSGVIETTKKLTPEKERGLIAYAFNQQIDEKVLEGKVIDKEESSWNGKKYTETPFVKDVKVGSKYTLIQTWPTRINEKFKDAFEMSDVNPNTKKFEAAAVNDYKAAIQALFGEDATTRVPFKYCYKVTENDKHPCYAGVTEHLLMYFQENEEAMKDVSIKEITKNGFVATGEDLKGNKVEKTFEMHPKTEYVIYKKVGWETMGCCKIKEQFDKECDFLGDGE